MHPHGPGHWARQLPRRLPQRHDVACIVPVPLGLLGAEVLGSKCRHAPPSPLVAADTEGQPHQLLGPTLSVGESIPQDGVAISWVGVRQIVPQEGGLLTGGGTLMAGHCDLQ